MTDTQDLDARHVWHPFTQAKTAPPPIPIARAEGIKLIAEDGREFLDMVSSWWVNLHGHAHPVVADAIADQAKTMEQVIFADFTHSPAATLAARITELLPQDLNRTFFSDDGSTAVEVALKLAHQYWRNKGQIRPRFIAFDGGYHGDTVGAMSAGRSSGFFDAFNPLLFPVDSAPYPATWIDDDNIEQKEAEALAGLDRLIKKYQFETAGVIIEPLIQGAGGMRMVRPSFLRTVAERVSDAGLLLIFDEVMTGFGRTGGLFGCLSAETTPDIICLSKGLTAGFMPLSLTICRDAIFETFLGDDLEKAFLHGHSFTANPLGCAAGLASLDLLLDPACTKARQMIEDVHLKRLSDIKNHPAASQCRLQGTVAALTFKTGDQGYSSTLGPKMKAFFLERGLLIRPLGSVVYLLPPYCVTGDELNQAWDAIAEALETFG